MRKNGPGCAKSAGVNPSSGAPNRANGRENCCRILLIGLHQNIEVFGCAWIETA